LHGDDSKLILLVDPDKEGLVVVMVDTSSLWPVSLKSSRLEILVTTLEEEMIGDQLFLLLWGHGSERVVFTSKLTGELTEGGGDELLDIFSLLSGDGGTKWVIGKVWGNSNSSRVDHLVFVSWERWALEQLVVHGGEMLVTWLVTVVGLNDLVKEWSKRIVGVVGTSVGTDTGVGPLGSRKDTLLEGEAELVSSVLALLPDILGEALLQERGSTSWEMREARDVLPGVEMGAHHAAVVSLLGNSCCVRSTHLFCLKDLN